MQNSCISTKCFEKTCAIYTKSEPLEVFMGNDTNDVIDNFSNTLLQRFKKHKKHQMVMDGNVFLIVLNYYIIILKE